MAEFPGFGRHCSFPECHLLDFLPVKCDACNKDFCGNHFTYDSHKCESSYKKDVQVPVCPLCCQPVPVARGEIPDIRVGDHIDRDCIADPVKKLKDRVYCNRCSQKGCRKRELVPLRCSACGANYCLKHRHTNDHDCIPSGSQMNTLSNSALSAISRLSSAIFPSSNSHAQSTTIAKSLSQDELLARALNESLNGPYIGEYSKQSEEDIDRQLAQQLQRDEYQIAHSRMQNGAQRVPSNSTSDKCVVS